MDGDVPKFAVCSLVVVSLFTDSRFKMAFLMRKNNGACK